MLQNAPNISTELLCILVYKFIHHNKTSTTMKKLIAFSTIVFTLLALNVSAATTSHRHKYKHPSKSHKVKHHRGHGDPSYQN
jgi:hypothetical protein